MKRWFCLLSSRLPRGWQGRGLCHSQPGHPTFRHSSQREEDQGAADGAGRTGGLQRCGVQRVMRAQKLQ